MTPEQRFENELEIFRTETEKAVQFFYADPNNTRCGEGPSRGASAFNRAPLFWNTNLGALQTGSFIVLGRIFDQSSRHNVDRLLKYSVLRPTSASSARRRWERASRMPIRAPPPGGILEGCVRSNVKRLSTSPIACPQASCHLRGQVPRPQAANCSPTRRYQIRRMLVRCLRKPMSGNSNESCCSYSPFTMRYGCFL